MVCGFDVLFLLGLWCLCVCYVVGGLFGCLFVVVWLLFVVVCVVLCCFCCFFFCLFFWFCFFFFLVLKSLILCVRTSQYYARDKIGPDQPDI